MIFTKEHLEKLYCKMSIDEMAIELDIAKSTLYYYMRKFNIPRRSKSEAQAKHLEHAPHQRSGKNHSKETVDKISNGTRKFWDSSNGKKQKRKLGDMRREEWNSSSPRQRLFVINRLQSAERPSPGQLSKFGQKLADFLEQREHVQTGMRLTPNHISDIILDERKIVIELLLPVSVYGEQQKQRLEARYEKLTTELNDLGYRVVVIEDRSNSISNARCSRVYDALLRFFNDPRLQKLTIVS